MERAHNLSKVVAGWLALAIPGAVCSTDGASFTTGGASPGVAAALRPSMLTNGRAARSRVRCGPPVARVVVAASGSAATPAHPCACQSPVWWLPSIFPFTPSALYWPVYLLAV